MQGRANTKIQGRANTFLGKNTKFPPAPPPLKKKRTFPYVFSTTSLRLCLICFQRGLQLVIACAVTRFSHNVNEL